MTFWISILVVVAVVIGLSVLIGKSLSRPPRGEPLSRHQQMTGLKASGALRHRKSNRD